MIVTGKIADAQLSLDGRLRLILDINEKSKALTELESIKECEKLNIKIEKYHNSRSLSANAYLWQLLDKMAKVLGSDKDTMYLLQLSKYGVFTDLQVLPEAVETLKSKFRYIEVIDEGYDDSIVRVYFGSSGYTTKEMSYLIDGTVRDAKELGIETLTPDELERMLISWKGDANGVEMTLSTAAEKYIESKSNVLSPATIKGYDKIYRNMPVWILDKKIVDITQDDLNRFVNELSLNKSPKTVRNYHGFVSAVLGVYAPSLSISTHLPQNIKKDDYIPSDDDIKALLAELKNTRYYVPIVLMAYGLRRSEVLAITSDDVDGECIHISKALVKDINNKWVIKTTKTEESTRDIFVPSDVTDYILDKGYAFHGHVSAIYRALEDAQDKLNIPHFSPHKMRHYFASKMHSLGVPDADIMELGGWKTDNVMKTVYRHSLETEKKKKRASMQLANALFN